MRDFYRRYIETCNAHEFVGVGVFVEEDVSVNGEPHGIAAYIAGLEAVVIVEVWGDLDHERLAAERGKR